MNYEIIYYFKDNKIDSDNYLYLYDFGNIKGFLYDNEFKLFKILKKDSKENIFTEYCVSCEQIPLKALSIEKYNCKYENNLYKTQHFTIEVSSYFKPSQPLLYQPSLPQPLVYQPSVPQPSVPQPSLPQPSVPQPLHKKQINKRTNLIKNVEHPSPVSEKIQQAQLFQQSQIQLPKNQWMSLEQIMKHSLPAVLQAPSLQQIQVNQSSQILKKKSYQHLRQPQRQVQKSSQDLKSQHSSINQSLVLV